MAHTVTFIPGDGIGPEVMDAMRRAVDATGVKILWEEQLLGETAYEKVGDFVPAATIDSVLKNKVAIKGPCATPKGTGFRSVNVALRKALDLYINLRPTRALGLMPAFPDVDIVSFRENTEDLYAGVEYDIGTPKAAAMLKEIRDAKQGNWADDAAAISLKIISRSGSERIIRAAFEYAAKNGRKRVSCIHKANIMKFTDGLFLNVFGEVAKEYEGKVTADDVIVDAAMMQLVQKPQTFDVMVLPNLYGDIATDLCAGLIGGLGIAPSANIGAKGAVFEAVHGSAPDIAGQGKANPTASMLSAVMMLRHLGEASAAQRLEDAVVATVREGTTVTPDLAKKGTTAATTTQFTDAVIARL
jgi:isocitrate dehydrogenase (NAD+)